MITSNWVACTVLILASIWSDVKTHRIPNSVVLIGLVAGLSTSMQSEGIGMANSLFGGALGLLAFLPFYFFRILGAGDAKLLMAVGTFSGNPGVIYIALLSGIFGGILGLLLAIYHQSFYQIARNTHTAIEIFICRQSLRKNLREFDLKTSNAKIPYALAIGLGTLAYAQIHNN